MHHVTKAGTITGDKNPSQAIGLDIKPYGILGFDRGSPNPFLPQADYESEAEYDGSVDIFYRITSSLVSSTTINTDFAETEVDSRQVNLTRFPLFFPEKRSFFLEDAGIFEFAKSEDMGPPGFGGSGDIMPFFSRRIGCPTGTRFQSCLNRRLGWYPLAFVTPFMKLNPLLLNIRQRYRKRWCVFQGEYNLTAGTHFPYPLRPASLFFSRCVASTCPRRDKKSLQA